MERVDHCSWDRPGHNPFMGDVVAAIDRYTEIPTPVRMRLKQRMQARQYDDLVDIRRDEIRGRARYEPAIRDMHFGIDRVCRQVSRAGWTAQMHERGLVYCEAGHCILVPTVCRNVSRIERLPSAVAAAQDDTMAGAPQGRATASPSADLLSAARSPTRRRRCRPRQRQVSTGHSAEHGACRSPTAAARHNAPRLRSTPTVALRTGVAVRATAITRRGLAPRLAVRGPILYVPGGTAAFGKHGRRQCRRQARWWNWAAIRSLATPPPMATVATVAVASAATWLWHPAIGGASDFQRLRSGASASPIGGSGSPLGHGAVTPVPEPSTWLSLLIGLAAVAGATARRRRNSAMAQGSAGAPRRAVQERS